jgi:hypothetical protein
VQIINEYILQKRSIGCIIFELITLKNLNDNSDYLVNNLKEYSLEYCEILTNLLNR